MAQMHCLPIFAHLPLLSPRCAFPHYRSRNSRSSISRLVGSYNSGQQTGALTGNLQSVKEPVLAASGHCKHQQALQTGRFLIAVTNVQPHKAVLAEVKDKFTLQCHLMDFMGTRRHWWGWWQQQLLCLRVRATEVSPELNSSTDSLLPANA